MSDHRPETHASAGLLSLCSRILAAEIDAVLYRRLLDSTDADSPPLLGADIAGLDEQAGITELAVEFCRLFVGPRPECPPYPSAYGAGRLLRGDSERRFTEFLSARDLRVEILSPFKFLSDDHIAVQLAAVVTLTQIVGDERLPSTTRAPAASAVSILCQRHLHPTLPDFTAALTKSARLAPYTTVGAVLLPALNAVVTDLPTFSANDIR
ncbi:TorD/DmsD family molecular chaperone [Actinokineospora sp.]|uniref:TorD/DmsD family molecular chaperone n=1 Tax=Actinokineospora sp. TaxID=1872133 RepID=UPI0040376602